MDTLKARGIDVKGIAWFIAIAYILAWLLDVPIWLSGGLTKVLGTQLGLLVLLRNFTPAVASFVVTRWISPLPKTRVVTGLRWGSKGSRWGLYWLFALVVIPFLFYVVAPLMSSLCGVAPLDLTGFSGYRAAWESVPGGSDTLQSLPIQSLVVIALLTLPLFTLVTAPFAFGEEWGWRGYLLTQLLPLGQWPALLITGVIWGLWHLPIFAAAPYPLEPPIVGLILFVIFATIWGVILGWMRLATDSLWPAVLGHAGIDSGQSLLVAAVFGKAGVVYDTAVAGPLGLTGWLAPLAVIALLVVTRRLPVREALQTGRPELVSVTVPETRPSVPQSSR